MRFKVVVLGIPLVLLTAGCKRLAHLGADGGVAHGGADAAALEPIPFPAAVPAVVAEAKVLPEAPLRAGHVTLGAPLVQGGAFEISDGAVTPPRLVVTDVSGNPKERPRMRLLDRTSGKVLATFYGDQDFRLSARAGVLVGHATAKGPAELVRLDTGAAHEPRFVNEAGAPLTDPLFVLEDEATLVGVVAREAGDAGVARRWAGMIDGTSTDPVRLTVAVPYTPYDGVYDRDTESVTWLPVGGYPIPYGVDASNLLLGDAIGSECTVVRVEPHGASSCRGTGKLPLDHQQRTDWLGGDLGLFYGTSHVLVDTRARAMRPLHAPIRDPRTKSCSVLATLARPARALEACQDEKGAATALLWSREKVVTWAEPWLSSSNGTRGFAMEGLEREPVAHLGDTFGKTAERTTHLFVDLETMHVLHTKEVTPLRVVFGSARPALAYEKRGKSLVLEKLDVDRGEITPIAAYADCPGMLREDGRAKGRVLVTCITQPNPTLFVFRYVWSELIDLDRGARYRLPARGELLLDDGTLIASDRKLDGAEAVFGAHAAYAPKLE